MITTERERNMLDFDDVLDVEDVFENGEIIFEEMSEEENDESGVTVYSYKGKYVVLGFDVGGSLGGEEVFDSIDEIKSEYKDYNWIKKMEWSI